MFLVAQQVSDHGLLPYFSTIIQRQIDECNDGRLVADVDPSAGMIPAQFHKSVGKAMPLLYDRLSREIRYAPGVPEAMVDVLKDFLIRWGGSFEDFEPHHFTYLNELCDRHVHHPGVRAQRIEVGGHEDDVVASRRHLAVPDDVRIVARSPKIPDVPEQMPLGILHAQIAELRANY